jgi:hypothetical protein
MEKPIILPDGEINLNGLKDVCSKYIDCLADGTYDYKGTIIEDKHLFHDLYRHEIYAVVFEALFGADVWKWKAKDSIENKEI